MKVKVLKASCYIIGILILYYLLIVLFNNSHLLYISTKKISETEIKYYVNTDTLTNESATLKMENNSNDIWEYGHEELQKQIMGIWHTIVPSIPEVFITKMTMPRFFPKTTYEYKFEFSKQYGNLTKGKYRIIRNMTRNIDDNNSEEYNIAAYFEIK